MFLKDSSHNLGNIQETFNLRDILRTRKITKEPLIALDVALKEIHALFQFKNLQCVLTEKGSLEILGLVACFLGSGMLQTHTFLQRYVA